MAYILSPAWVKQIPSHLRPDKQTITKLEALRVEYRIPADVFAMRILGSPHTTRRVQELLFLQMRKQMPRASKKELLKAVFTSRALLPEPHGYGMNKEESEETMKSINSLDDLVDFFVARDEEAAFPDPLGLDIRIDEVLANAKWK